MIEELTEERERIAGIIKSLEVMERKGSANPPKRRGRKFMDEAARAEVADRMKRYWAKKRETATGGTEKRAMSASAAA